LDGIVCGGDMAGGAVAFAIAKLLRNVPSAGGQMNMHEPQFDGILMLMQILSFIDSLKNTKLQFLIPTENLNIYGE